MTKSSMNKLTSIVGHLLSKDKTMGRKIFFAACSLVTLFSLLGVASSATSRVYIKKFPDNGHYQLIVNNRPYIIKGVCYNPIPVGDGYDYDWWADSSKPWLVDGKLMKNMGVNTIRIYQPPTDEPEKVRRVIRDLYDKYGIRTIMGHWLGYWNYPCPFYGDDNFKQKVKQEVLEMVEFYKDEPGVLLWVLGNENNYSCLGQIRPWTSDEILGESDPREQNQMRLRLYYSFVNEVSEAVHIIDPDHPVALGNGELVGLEVAKEYCPDVDLVSCVVYRGKTFGNLFNSLKLTIDKPLFLAEFGADAYDAYADKEDQNVQAFFLESQWQQIYRNLANNIDGAGNCLGGTIFEWTDEWWKHDEYCQDNWSLHDRKSNWFNPSYYFDVKADNNMNMNEEWFGIVAVSPELENGVNKRIPRKAYYVLKEFWRKPNFKKLKYRGLK